MKGWYTKYLIRKTDGSPVDPEAVYFLLRLDTDPHARVAALAYANSIEGEDPLLAKEIKEKLKEYNK